MEITSESDALGTLILVQALSQSSDASYEVMIDALLVAIAIADGKPCESIRQHDPTLLR